MTDLALDTDLDAQHKESLTVVRDSGQGLLAAINNILDFAKIKAAKLELESIGLGICNWLHAVTKPFVFTAGRKGLALVDHVDDDVPENLIGNPARLRQIPVKLIGNSLKFTETGEIRVDITLQEQAGRWPFAISG